MKEKRSMNSSRSVSLVLRFFAILLLGFTLIITVSLIVPRIFNYAPYLIISESMTPQLNVGDVVYVRDEDPSTYVEGDVISFYMNSDALTPVTHRVVKNDLNKKEFITKGDANEKEDLIPIPYEYVIGRVKFRIPLIGNILLFLESITGKIIFVLLFLAGVLMMELSNLKAVRK